MRIPVEIGRGSEHEYDEAISGALTKMLRRLPPPRVLRALSISMETMHFSTAEGEFTFSVVSSLDGSHAVRMTDSDGLFVDLATDETFHTGTGMAIGIHDRTSFATGVEPFNIAYAKRELHKPVTWVA